jgi:hypothetical protein
MKTANDEPGAKADEQQGPGVFKQAARENIHLA